MDMFGLYKVQILLLLGLLFVPLSTCSCFDEDELEKKADKMLKRYHPQPFLEPEAVDGSLAPECPVYKQLNEDISNRSISPWRYIRQTKEDRFPRTLVVAQCLCKGCIIPANRGQQPQHTMSYNSALIKQSRVVIRKIRGCDNNAKKYRLVPENELVAVGCTCVRPKV